MKTPIYEPSPGALRALLATRSFVFADLYTFTAVNGGPVLRYAAADLDIAWGGNVWSHGGPAFDQGASGGSRPTGHWKVGLDVDSWSVIVAPRLADPVSGAAFPDQIAGQPWLHAVRGGALDGATATVDRAYLAVWPTGPSTFTLPAVPVGVINVFTGRVAAIDVSRTQVGITINSHLELLDISMPRRVFQAPCQHTLFDAGCTLVAAAHAVSGSVAAGSSQSVIHAGIPAPPGSGSYALGRLVFTSGANAGFQRGIRSYLAGLPAQLKLVAPLSFPVSAGDAFTAYPGCDKQRETCALFGNSANFRGFPFIPAPELSV